MPNSVTVVDTKLQTFVQVKDLKFKIDSNSLFHKILAIFLIFL